MDVAEALQKVKDISSDLQQFGRKVSSLCDGSEDVNEGISLLQAKSATLMRYNYNLTQLVLAKLQGRGIETIAEKLVEDWVVMEKIRPIEKKLRYQIDALLKNAKSQSSERQTDADRHRPDPSAVVIDEDADGSPDGEAGVYRPPRIAEVVYDGDRSKKDKREEREREKYKARTLRSEGVREMLAEVKGRPEEVRDDELGGTRKSAAVQRLMREDAERRKFEEENFTRLNVTRKDKKRRRDIERALEGPTMDGSNEFADLIAVADRVTGSSGKRGKPISRKESTSRSEEQYKLEKLDEITESINRGPNGSGKRSRGKKRRR